MKRPVRVVHYVNQFFAGIGGEEKADIHTQARDGAVGPGRVLQKLLGDRGTVVGTIVCGDNYINDQSERALAEVASALQRLKPDVLVAGPAFEAGRYGLACGAVCRLATGISLPAVTGMHPENPGVASYRQDAVIIPTAASPTEMEGALESMIRIALKLAAKEELGSAAQEGYLPRGVRKLVVLEEPGYKRAVNMLARKVKGIPFETEIPIRLPEVVPPAPPIADISRAVIALVTSGGLVRKGNPEKQVAGNARMFHRHSVAELESLTPEGWEIYHSGYFNRIANSNPNYILPLSFLRDIQRHGGIGDVYPWMYALPGVGTPIAKSRELGREIAADLKRDQVDACILVST